jgi:hypothetical protein
MTRATSRIAAGVIGLVTAVGLLAVGPASSALAAPPEESLTAPFTSGPAAATTQNTYSGQVTVTVSGYGEAAGTSCTDAFYGFAGSAVSPCDTPADGPWPAHEFGLYINGSPATDLLETPPAYSDSHTYILHLRFTGRPGVLTFGVGDLYTVDNWGQYQITVRHGR